MYLQVDIDDSQATSSKKIKLTLLEGLSDSADNSIEFEIRRYFEIWVDRNVDSMDWWRKHQKEFPNVAKLAAIYFNYPSTSASSEQALSTAGNHMTAKRSNLHPSRLNMLCCIHDNYDIITQNDKVKISEFK